MLQTGTVKTSTLGLLRALQTESLLASTRLVGGTALSLQIGHRESDDLDLFSFEPLDMMGVQTLLISKYAFVPSVIAENTLIGFIQGVKIDVIYHPFQWLEEAIEEDGMRIASIADIAAMKMHAIINSGKRPKDFVDIAFLSMHYSYNELKQLLLRRYPAYDSIMADKAIIYFGDIDDLLIPEIRMLDYIFDFPLVKKRVLKMTDYPDKVYSTAPLKQVRNNRTKK
ncbi:MAG: nucleotidyl transferase AbiEii/AbiGii toxin family protein [Bacteroidaceae bacterium]|nr:nucleotidyl transferase AbiEii/AbiGii toxin family protein [Bacteroidaceae bacterium]